jgi:putative transposase
MQNKFKNQYRIPSTRLQNWNYNNNGAYFITICIHNRECFFGHILDYEMNFNEIGQLAEQIWLEIPKQFPFIELGNYIVMPNHVHGILIIDKSSSSYAETRFIASNLETNSIETNSCQQQTRLIASLQQGGGVKGDKNPMFNENISKIIRWYKG